MGIDRPLSLPTPLPIPIRITISTINNEGVSHSNDYCNAFNNSDRIRDAMNWSDKTTGRTTVDMFLEYDEARRIFKVQCPLLIDGSSMEGELWIEYYNYSVNRPDRTYYKKDGRISLALTYKNNICELYYLFFVADYQLT